MRILVAFLFVGLTGNAQLFSFGLRGGIPLTDAYSSVTTTTSASSFVKTYSQSKEYEIGPMVELHLPFGLAVEADALYHPLNLATQIYNGSGTTNPGLSASSTDNSSWEFPILGKYHFLPVPLLKPYVEAGPAFRALGSGASYLSNSGIALGGGVEIKIAKLRIEPEIRYTHWGSDSPTAALVGAAASNVNQAAFLVGIAF